MSSSGDALGALEQIEGPACQRHQKDEGAQEESVVAAMAVPGSDQAAHGLVHPGLNEKGLDQRSTRTPVTQTARDAGSVRFQITLTVGSGVH